LSAPAGRSCAARAHLRPKTSASALGGSSGSSRRESAEDGARQGRSLGRGSPGGWSRCVARRTGSARATAEPSSHPPCRGRRLGGGSRRRRWHPGPPARSSGSVAPATRASRRAIAFSHEPVAASASICRSSKSVRRGAIDGVGRIGRRQELALQALEVEIQFVPLPARSHENQIRKRGPQRTNQSSSAVFRG
jgi:hypothetical protein